MIVSAMPESMAKALASISIRPRMCSMRLGYFRGSFRIRRRRGGGRRRPRAGADLRYNLTVSFRDAAKGTVDLNIPKREVCSECSGSGSAPGHLPETCKHCHGQGQVTQSQGFFRISVPCPVCRGEGKVITILRQVPGAGHRAGQQKSQGTHPGRRGQR